MHLGIVPHGAYFVHRKGLATAPDACLSVDARARELNRTMTTNSNSTGAAGGAATLLIRGRVCASSGNSLPPRPVVDCVRLPPLLWRNGPLDTP